MLDVHPPHQAAHSWRDFFIHIATIVIGLLIALGLEQTVESLHHRHQVHVARERIREEARVNQRILHEDELGLARIDSNLERALALVRDAKAGHASSGQTLDFSFGLQGFYNAAYSNAKDTGVLGLMPYEEAAMMQDAYLANEIAFKDGLDLWSQLQSADSALHGKSLDHLDPDEFLPLIDAISMARGKARLAADAFRIQDREWDALLSGQFRTDIR